MWSHYLFCVYVACHGLVVLKPSTLVHLYLLAFEYYISSSTDLIISSWNLFFKIIGKPFGIEHIYSTPESEKKVKVA